MKKETIPIDEKEELEPQNLKPMLRLAEVEKYPGYDPEKKEDVHPQEEIKENPAGDIDKIDDY